ncbi:hypothetical protein F4778DRAFT_741965 [Xylariomycetidae sp. FL2044]|nr:hypothetical protein F4778DRAFT_741965 [Xylariomycetidae sp. FL2044]
MAILPEAVAGTSIAFSFILFGNAVTQSFMAVPGLLLDFPAPSSPDHTARARLLGRQWPVFWVGGNNFFRPISTLGIFGYAYTAWAAASSAQGSRLGDWRLFAVSAVCHLVTVVHSALNMQPINEKLTALKDKDCPHLKQAETYGRRWIKFNTVRLITPVIAGTIALSQLLGAR